MSAQTSDLPPTLSDAVVADDLRRIEELVTKEIPPKINDRGETPLMLAARLNKPDAFKLLYPHHCIDSRINDLMASLFLGDVDVARDLIANYPYFITAKDILNRPVFFYVLFGGHRSSLELMKSHIDQTHTDKAGMTLLMYAIEMPDKSNWDITASLLRSLTSRFDVKGNTNLMYAVNNCFLPAVEMCIKRESGMKNRAGLNALTIARRKLKRTSSSADRATLKEIIALLEEAGETSLDSKE